MRKFAYKIKQKIHKFAYKIKQNHDKEAIRNLLE